MTLIQQFHSQPNCTSLINSLQDSLKCHFGSGDLVDDWLTPEKDDVWESSKDGWNTEEREQWRSNNAQVGLRKTRLARPDAAAAPELLVIQAKRFDNTLQKKSHRITVNEVWKSERSNHCLYDYSQHSLAQT